MNHHEIRLKTIDTFLEHPQVPEYYKSKLVSEKIRILVAQALNEANERDNERGGYPL